MKTQTDGASAAAEAMLMTLHATGRKRLVVAGSVHPEYRQVLATYLRHLGVEIVTVAPVDGTLSLAQLEAAVNDQTAGVLVQHPNFFGCLEEVEAVAAAAHASQIKLILDPPTAEVGATYEGRVVNITKFGAFVNILPGRDGLVHISMLSDQRVEKVTDVLKEGQEVKVLVLDVDNRGRIKLSIKDVAAAEASGA